MGIWGGIRIQICPAQYHDQSKLDQTGGNGDQGIGSSHKDAQDGNHKGQLIGEKLPEVDRHAVHDGAKESLPLAQMPLFFQLGNHGIGGESGAQADDKG